MREIKFRAWDGKQFYYFTLEELYWHDPRLFHEFDWHKSDWTEYTGLKDKNGKEAYHHDLFIHTDRNQGKPIEIIWIRGGWCGRYVGLKHSFRLDEWEMEKAEIIGNVYENKDLIEGEK